MKINISAELKNKIINAISTWIKDALVKKALKAFLGTAAGVGFKAWLVTFVIEEIYEEAAEPVLKRAGRRAIFEFDEAKGRYEFKKFENAKSADDFDSSIGDILN